MLAHAQMAASLGLEGKRALVTGGSRGIGAAIARELANAGANVVVGYRSGKDEAEAIASEAGGRAVQADVSNVDDAKRLVDEAGEVDVLVNNAGITRDGVLARMTDDDWRSVLETNLSSTFYTCRAVSRGMMKRRAGSIVNLSSIVGLHGNWGQTNYAASKGAIVAFTKSLAQELGSRGIRANVVAPGYIKTQLTDAIPEEAQQQMLGLTPLGRFGDPEDVARAVRFLASDDAAFITGEVMVVGGGLGM
jgi:3-oxoacyl-[acyl-carrier protein] reductase